MRPLLDGYHVRHMQDGRVIGAAFVKDGLVTRLFITRRGLILYWLEMHKDLDRQEDES